MSDYRCFTPELDPEVREIVLSPFESHHLVSTNRARVGDSVVLFNGKGVEWDSTLDVADRKNAVLSKKAVREYEFPSPIVTLAVALIKGKTFDTILRQATELGVSSIQPLITERTQVRPNNTSSKVAKWRTQLIEGCKQSGNPWLPDLHEPKPLLKWLKKISSRTTIAASLGMSTIPWHNIPKADSYSILIGPEGDFSDAEYRLLIEQGVYGVSLGPHVLRSETAVVAALAQLRTHATLGAYSSDSSCAR